MTLILSGTDGLSDVDGSAATPAIRGTDANTGIFFPAADTIAFSEGGVESMRINSSGNVGIGSSATNRLSLTYDGASGVATIGPNSSSGNTTLTLGTSNAGTYGDRINISYLGNVGIGGSNSAYNLVITNNNTTTGANQYSIGATSTLSGTSFSSSFLSQLSIPTGITADKAAGYRIVNPTLVGTGAITNNYGIYIDDLTSGTNDYGIASLVSSGTNKWNIYASGTANNYFAGNVLVGTTSVPTNGASGSGAATFSDSINVKGITSHAGISGAYQTNRMNLQWNGSATRLWVDATDTGSITVSSDYRVKKDIETQTQNALSRIALIRPVTYTYADYEPFSWKADGVSREGFIAHELQVVVPSAVDGEKDAENQIQSLKLDALCAVMVKAIQEQQALITQLQADVEALKAQP